ncbi:MAG: hypothetical protein ACOX8S_01795 [Christensenellales bacterium]|jgi:hypothetical protein
MSERRLMQRSDKVDFIKVPAQFAGGDGAILRMKGFTELTTSRSANTVERQYIDEAEPTIDVTSVTTSKDYDFERYINDPVHDYLADIIDNERIGTQAVVEIYTVDFFDESADEGRYACSRRKFTLEPASEGGDVDAYSYSGVFRVNGPLEKGYATAVEGTLPMEISEISWSEQAG